jgi:hypothetical protein
MNEIRAQSAGACHRGGPADEAPSPTRPNAVLRTADGPRGSHSASSAGPPRCHPAGHAWWFMSKQR